MTNAHTHLEAGERRTRVVVLLSLATMALELAFGWLTGSMALIADGWHMATHVGAVGLAWLAFSDGQRRPSRSMRSRYAPYRSEYDTRHPRESDRSLLDSAPEATARSSDMLRRGRNNLELMIREYPLAVGAAAAVLGATLGMVVPETERENELMGEVRETAVERAQEVASGAATRVKEAAADAVTRAVVGD